MNDTMASPGLPAEFPDRLRPFEARLRAVLGSLDQSIWQFAVKHDVLVGVRRWPKVGLDTVGVVWPDVVIGTRHVVDAGRVWVAHGSVEHVVRAIDALGAAVPQSIRLSTLWTPRT